MIKQAKALWERIPAGYRQMLVLGGVLTITAWIIVSILDDGSDDRGLSAQRLDDRPKGITEQLLTDVDPRDLGIDGLSNRVVQLEQALREAQSQLKQRGTRERRLDEAQLSQLRQQQRQEIAQLEKAISELEQAQRAREADAPDPVPAAVDQAESADEEPALDSPAAESLRWSPPDASATPPQPLEIRHIGAAEQPVATAPASTPTTATPATENRIIVPAGSILQGVLLSGMDAPTGRLARRDPYPALIRLKDNAILPNYFRAEVNECFVTVAGFGELSSERTYLRSELITCVRKDGGVIEVPVDGYAVGEDGKLGLRGRVVSKQGQVIARAMQVAFLEGVSSIFNQRQVSVISTDPDASPFQEVLSNESAQAAAVTGTGQALDRLAQYYLNMAQDIFPIIEIDAGRSVELILNRGVFLELAEQRGT